MFPLHSDTTHILCLRRPPTCATQTQLPRNTPGRLRAHPIAQPSVSHTSSEALNDLSIASFSTGPTISPKQSNFLQTCWRQMQFLEPFPSCFLDKPPSRHWWWQGSDSELYNVYILRLVVSVELWPGRPWILNKHFAGLLKGRKFSFTIR